MPGRRDEPETIERRERLHSALRDDLVKRRGGRHLHCVGLYSATFFEIRRGTDREYTIWTIDESGKIRSNQSTLHDD